MLAAAIVAQLYPAIQAEVSNAGRIAFPAEDCTIEAGDSAIGKQATVSMLAYNGGLLRVGGYDAPVVVAVNGIEGLGKSISILRSHDKNRIVGHTVATAKDGKIFAAGRLAGKSSDRDEVEALAADGYQWQASIGASPLVKPVFIKAGQKFSANGQEFEGPAYLVTKSRLSEISLLPVGADADTVVEFAVAAEEGDGSGNANNGNNGSNGGGDALSRILAERTRRERIETIAVEASQAAATTGDIGRIQEYMEAAIQAGDTPQAFELALLRNVQRPQGRISSGGGNELRGRDLELAVEASLMIELGKSASELEAMYPEQVLTAMDRHVELRAGLSLQDAMMFAADQNRQRVSRRDVQAMLRASFQDVEASGQSTFTLSGIFSAIANKFLKESFDFVEAAWREIAEVGSVRDFKTITSYALTGDMTYEKVAPNGELKHATAGEATYTNRAETYGKMFAISRTDIINDDLGALRAVPRKLGRGGALMLNDVFWAAFLNHGSFFTSGNKNLIGTGSSAPWYLLCDPADLAMIQVVFLNGKQMPTVEQTDAEFKQLGIQMRGYHDFGVSLQEPRAAVKSPAALDLAGLKAANQLFLDQVDQDGKKLALMPRILLVSTSNADTAMELMKSPVVVSGNTAKLPNANIYAGRYRMVYSAYLPNA